MIGKVGRTAERRLAERVGGRQTVGSGNQVGDKGDIRLQDVLIESKATEASSVSVKLEWLAKIAQEARAKGLTPALALQFVSGDGRQRRDGGWVMIPERVWQELVSAD